MSKRPTQGELCDAIWLLGGGGQEIVGEPRFDVWKRLTELKMVEREPAGEPVLTPLGKRAYGAIEGGDNDGEIPELDDEPLDDE